MKKMRIKVFSENGIYGYWTKGLDGNYYPWLLYYGDKMNNVIKNRLFI